MTNENSHNPESWENLILANNFIFCKVMESEPELCRQLLELLLHIKIDHLETPQAERTMKAQNQFDLMCTRKMTSEFLI